ncbi:hypothetical protein BH10PSE17_BH10PSE17_27510 [soil metagenome]
MSFTVLVDDNFHYMDEDERTTAGVFETAEQALACAQGIVDRWLLDAHKPGMKPVDLFASYKSFGEDPFIVPSEGGGRFSAWEYAERRCEEICR